MSLSLNPFDLLSAEGAGGRRRNPAPKAAAPAPAPTPAQAPAKPAAAPATKPAAPQPTDKKAPNAKPAPNANAGAKKENGTARPRPQGGEGQKGKGERRPQQQQGAAGTPPVARQAAGGQPIGGEELPQGKPQAHHFAGERRERAPARGRKFDRRSGTGRPPTENKRSGSGKGNWGKIGENEEAAANATKENGETEKEETEKPAEGEAAAATPADGDAQPAKEPEKELKGLDEYYEQLKAKAVKVEAPKKREAGEGVDQSAWKEYVPLAKEDAVDSLAPKTKKKEAEKKETANVSAELLSFHLAPPQGIEERGGGRRRERGDRSERGDRQGRGGRGRGRGDRRGGRGGQQGGRVPRQEGAESSSLAFAADDFPVLGAKPAAAAAPAPVKA